MNDPSSRRLDRLPAKNDEGETLAVIEACQGSRNKLRYHPGHAAFELHGVLPAGMSFPYDFGFVPSTLGEDGDPLDVLVLMDEAVPVGSVVPCRLVGVVAAEQKERDGEAVRNDRLLAVATASRRYASARLIADIAPHVLDEIERFFVFYNREKAVEFRPVGRHGVQEAERLLEAGRRAFQAGQHGAP
jgi:inorganic pyrophosphatase